MTALSCSRTVASEEQQTKCVKNSCASNFFGIPACVKQTTQCLFHCLELLPDMSSMKLMMGTASTARPFAFSRNGWGISAPKVFDASETASDHSKLNGANGIPVNSSGV